MYNSNGSFPVGPGSNTGGFGGGSGGGDGGIVRQGFVSVKDDGYFTSLLWSRKYLILREHALTFHKNEVSTTSAIVLTHHLSISLSRPMPTSSDHAFHLSYCARDH
jgi:protein-serine/threonine kinase